MDYLWSNLSGLPRQLFTKCPIACKDACLPLGHTSAMSFHLHFQSAAPCRGTREFLFEKPLTPSDVGKLNRLVIPKQYAERYFPMGGYSGVLLSFEDEVGKIWQFRYSYWTSSQSYVLTKGWSRFIREKSLTAGDVVLFQRRRCYAGERIFIGWKRRAAARGQVCDAPAVVGEEGKKVNSQILRLFGVNMRCGSLQ